MGGERTEAPYYPIHESILGRLNPEYAKFYNEHLINQQPVHHQPIEVSRGNGALIPGAGPQQPVQKIEDFAIKRKQSEGPDVMVRCFTPLGDKPVGGWPVTIYYHGGGWVLGNIQTENVVCSHLCARAKCVVVSVDYRLAPENPFPAAVHDSWEAILWVQEEGSSLVSLDLSKIAVAGSSAGGNLAAVMTHRAQASSGGPNFLTQLLMVPVMDNTAEVSNNRCWKELEFTAALPAKKMMWYRHHYLPNRADWANPEASPLLCEGDWKRLPRTLIVVGELDILSAEGLDYGAKLKEAGVEVKEVVMKGMPHPFLAMDGVMKAGKAAIDAMVESLLAVF